MAMNIKLKNLRMTLGSFNFEIEDLIFPEGKFSAVVGPNGAGKSTLLKCLASIIRCRSGSIIFDNQNQFLSSGKDLARMISYVPQELNLNFNYSVLDYVLTGRVAYIPLFSSPSSLDVEQALEALTFIGQSELADKPMLELSSGTRRLVLIARALAQNADILLLDEPISFLDPRNELEVLGLLKKLVEEKSKTVIASFHNLELAYAYADFIAFLKDGRLITCGKSENVINEEVLRQVYGIEINVVDYQGKKFFLK